MILMAIKQLFKNIIFYYNTDKLISDTVFK